MFISTQFQGRRRILKSGPAEEIIECGRHERGGGGREREGAPPLVRGSGGLPCENFEFLALLCAFLMFFFMRFGPDFCHDFLLEKIFLGA